MDPDFLSGFRRTLDESRVRLASLSDAEASRPLAPGKCAPRRPRPGHSLDHIAFEPVQTSAPATLAYLMRDYVAHLRHHLKRIG
jgi:hypothetical protein